MNENIKEQPHKNVKAHENNRRPRRNNTTRQPKIYEDKVVDINRITKVVKVDVKCVSLLLL